MKKLMFSFLISFLCQLANAQFEKGRWMLGVDINANSRVLSHAPNNNYLENTQLTTVLSSGRFLKNNWLIRAGLLYGHDNYENFAIAGLDNSIEKRNRFGIFVGANKYKKIISNVYFTATLSLGLAQEKLNFRNRIGTPTETFIEENRNSFSLNFSPIGITYVLGDKFMFSIHLLTLNYSQTNDAPSLVASQITDKNFYVSTNPIANGITINYLLKSKKQKR